MIKNSPKISLHGVEMAQLIAALESVEWFVLRPSFWFYKIQMILLKILENEDSYKDLGFIISKVNFTLLPYSFQIMFCPRYFELPWSLNELMQYEFLLG